MTTPGIAEPLQTGPGYGFSSGPGTGISVTIAESQLTLVEQQFNRLGPFTTNVIDVSLFASYYLSAQYEAANAGPPANTGVITLEWGDTALFNNVLYRQTIEINSVNTTDCGRSIIQDRMYGPFMRTSVAAGNGAVSTFTLLIYAGFRPFVGSMRCRELAPNPIGLSTDNTRLSVRQIVNAGSTVSLNVRLGTGMSSIFVLNDSTPYTAGTTLSGLLYSPELTVNRRFWQRTFTTVNQTFSDQVNLPRRALTLQLDNTDGANNHIAFLSLVSGEE